MYVNRLNLIFIFVKTILYDIMNKGIIYPRFIHNKPSGIDKLEGASQERLTTAIANHIVNVDDNLPHIIGLEGGWGVGKSNTVKLLMKKLEKDYYTFEYDAWGHQEELQRRSFLETLTRELIDAKILEGDTDVLINGEIQKLTWEGKLRNLLAKNVTRINKTIPKFNAGALWTAIALSLTPITVFIAERLESAQVVNNILCLILIAFLPIIIGLSLWLIFMYENKDMRNLGYLLKISNEENVETQNYETINEDEPTATKFKAWMQSVSDSIEVNNKKKLIIVFDNMDRLPADKVKELWSSIHTFFADGSFKNIWVLIPFDKKHLSCAFGNDNNDETKELTQHFISKTFPVVYRVAPPVVTDLKEIFNSFFIDAFSNTEIEKQETVNRIFRLEKPNATVREIILFINQLVALKGIWDTEIDILYMAIFSLQKDKILKDPINQILSGEYLTDKTTKFFTNEDTLQKNISALVYGVSIEHAEQIPIKKYISGCLNEEDGYDINAYSNHKHFVSILEDTIKRY